MLCKQRGVQALNMKGVRRSVGVKEKTIEQKYENVLPNRNAVWWQ